MKISDDGMPQPNAKNAFGFAHLLSAQDFAQRGPPDIVVGQVLYLEAEETGLRSTGIGCYVDDPVHEAFGIKSRSGRASITSTSVGKSRTHGSPRYLHTISRKSDERSNVEFDTASKGTTRISGSKQLVRDRVAPQQHLRGSDRRRDG